MKITGEYASFNPTVTNWDYTGLTADLESGAHTGKLQDKLGDFNFLISGSLAVAVNCKETRDCGELLREWSLSGSVAVEDLPFQVPYKEPVYPIPGMSYIIWLDKVANATQFMSQWRGMIKLNS